MNGDDAAVHSGVLEEGLDVRTDDIVHVRVFLEHLLLSLAEKLQILLIGLESLRYFLRAGLLECGGGPGLELVLRSGKAAHDAENIVIIGNLLPELDYGIAEDLNESCV